MALLQRGRHRRDAAARSRARCPGHCGSCQWQGDGRGLRQPQFADLCPGGVARSRYASRPFTVGAPFQPGALIASTPLRKPFYRLVHGEGDLLPGLVVDRFDDVVVVQLNTLGLERLAEEVVAALDKVLSPRVIVFKNDSSGRRQEQLESQVTLAKGELDGPVLMEENGVRFHVPVLDGQKTGWFFDHRANRAWLNGLVAGKRVLDVFSYIGGWGVQAAAHGASEVLCVDASAAALERVAENAALNGLHEQVAVGEGDAFEALAALKADGEQFDVVILDPPAFIKRRKDIANGERAYSKLNREAMRLLGRDGLLLSASCSMHLAPERLVEVVRGAVRHQDRHGQIIYQGYQAADHPVHPAIPETAYLKALGVRVFRD